MKKKTTLERFKEIQDLEVADEQGKTVKDILPYFCENVETALNRLEAIDNSNPSEALKCLKEIIDSLDDYADFEIKQEANEYLATIKQALLKVQEPKHYLKWEDLEKDRTYKVLLNGSKYELVKRYDDYEYRCNYITLQKKPCVSIFIYEYEKEIFNDLRLERVEE